MEDVRSTSRSPKTIRPALESVSRRQTIETILVIGGTALIPTASKAVDSSAVILKVQVSLAPDATVESAESPALYITCRPDTPDNIPAAILNGSRGKPPPVLSARIAAPTFPATVELQIPRDVTLEGAWDGIAPGSSITPPTSTQELWWKDMNLIVSARWDSDGVAATRSPTDLVGRTVWKHGSDMIAQLELGGRGAFGKFATGGKQ